MKKTLKSAQIIPIGFAVFIVLGTLFLMLPISTRTSYTTSWIDALFTATTSICVTGLVTVDTYAQWTIFGKIVILILIQVGGLGVVSILTMMLICLNQKITIKERVLIRDSFNLDTIDGLVKFLLKVVKGIAVVEFIGIIFYSFILIPEYGIIRGLSYSIFNSVSAFCNAGMDIMGPNSLENYNSNPLFLVNTMMLIVIGGLGYIVWFDIIDVFKISLKKRRNIKFFLKTLSEHTKLVLVLTIGLIFFGALYIFIMEYNNPNTIGNMNLSDKILNCFFQSITFRTAGFSTFSQKGLTGLSGFMGCILMFIGGSPMGTAGGIKTVTIFVVILSTIDFIRNKKDITIFKRTVNNELVRKSVAIIVFNFFVTIFLAILLCKTNNLDILDGMYETFSATATVGLSRNVTASLNDVGKIIIILSMYLGRVGPISLGLFFITSNYNKNYIKFADGKFLAG
ncbi:TrkH family potassium uptake protein [Lachnobacterium bovis]|uniref:Trk system potassium uptake protein TrkH n=1 Tax=Lachnobacterium bovis TaxID=140626 RepID=A0A1H9Q061_9FIRM|nr:potassium transporter TrkG [Lachnobacterium bovis]SER53936.1 trk system potassium uptake protein TrkH [Lachnobacterium bovis]